MLAPGRLVLLGHPVGHSLSEIFQQAALDAQGIALRYEVLDVPPDALGATVATLVAARAAGNVTIPHKEAIAERCGRLTAEAARAGALNAFRVEPDGTLLGHNTDIDGFEALARHVLGAARDGLRIAVLGAGGAAAAVLCAVERWPGARVTLANRSVARAESLAGRFPCVSDVTGDPADAVREADLVINATPLGFAGADPLPVDPSLLPRGAAVLDLVYRPGGTAWVRTAGALGHPAGDGTLMLLEQGALAFEFWFRRPAPRPVMAEALARYLTR